MVAVVQLVERQFVVLDVAGSSPVGHPNRAVGGHASAPTLLGSWLLPGRCASSSTAEQRTLNPQVLGSKPRGRTRRSPTDSFIGRDLGTVRARFAPVEPGRVRFQYQVCWDRARPSWLLGRIDRGRATPQMPAEVEFAV